MPNDVKDRLRRARESAGVSRAELARRTGRSQSTIRAHETGQNNIQPEAAQAYADVLGVRPEWLLYAANPPPDKLTVTSDMFTLVNVIGTIKNGYYVLPDEHKVDEPRQIVVPKFSFSRLDISAYINKSDDQINVETRTYLIVVPYRRGYMRKSDEVVLKIGEGSTIETGLWNVSSTNKEFGFYRGNKTNFFFSSMSFPRGASLPAHIKIAGVVVGRIELLMRRPSWEWDVMTTQDELAELQHHRWLEETEAQDRYQREYDQADEGEIDES